jgi:hypothetical protein
MLIVWYPWRWNINTRATTFPEFAEVESRIAVLFLHRIEELQQPDRDLVAEPGDLVRAPPDRAEGGGVIPANLRSSSTVGGTGPRTLFSP